MVRKISKRKIYTILFFLFIFIASTFVSFIYFSKNDKNIIEPLSLIPSSTPSPNIVSPPDIFTALLLGQGDPSHAGSALTDANLVVNVNNDSKTVTLIFIPRDLQVSLGDKDKIKINEVYSLGGLVLAKETIGKVINLPIDFAILVDFNYFTQIVDLLGGIDITIEKAFDDYYYPIAGKELDSCGMDPETLAAINATMSGFLLEKQYDCRYEHLHFDKGKTHVDGKTALKLARSRHSSQDGSDFSRGGRQLAILTGIMDQLISIEALKNVEQLFTTMANMVKTDLVLKDVSDITKLIINPENYQITKVVLSEENTLRPSKNNRGQYILIPKAGENDFSQIQTLVKESL